MRGCEEIRDQLPAYAEGDRASADCRRVEAHLAGCPACAQAAALLAETLARVRALPDPEVPDEFWAEFEAAVGRRIATEMAPRRPSWRWASGWRGGLSWLRPVPALSAAAALGLLLAIGLIRGPRAPREGPAADLIVVGESLPIAQNLDVLEHFDVLEDLDLLEQFSILRTPEFSRRLKRG